MNTTAKMDESGDMPDDESTYIWAADVVEHLALMGEVDARKWAATFVATVRDVPEIPTDEETMLSWFAAAIMAGYDRGRIEGAHGRD